MKASTDKAVAEEVEQILRIQARRTDRCKAIQAVIPMLEEVEARADLNLRPGREALVNLVPMGSIISSM